MPQTLTGWILFAAVILFGAGGGYMAARMLSTARDRKAIDWSDIVVTLELVGIMVASCSGLSMGADRMHTECHASIRGRSLLALRD